MNSLNIAAVIKKRNKVELSIPQKWEIIEYSKKFPKASQKSMILKFNKEFNTTIASSTISDILKQKLLIILRSYESIKTIVIFYILFFYIKVLLNKN